MRKKNKRKRDDMAKIMEEEKRKNKRKKGEMTKDSTRNRLS